MIDFDFVSPTKIYFGKDKEDELGKAAKAVGMTNVLLVYGSGRIKSDGLYAKCVSALEKEGIHYVDFGGVRPNPLAAKVREGVALAKSYSVDGIIAIGGGSIIDTAKSIAAAFYYEGDPFDFNLKKAVPTKALPLGVVLTFASAGSEASNSCVIQDDDLKIKQGFNCDLLRPAFAIENPELTYSVPPYQTAAGISDIIMHSLERYFCPSDGNELSDEWALDLIRNTIIQGRKVMENPHDYQARAAIMLNSTLSHNGLTHLGKKFGFVVHPLEHALSGYKADITHGAGVALIYPAWASYVYKGGVSKFAYFAKRVFDVSSASEEETAIIGIRSMKEFFTSIGMPATLEEVGLHKDDIPALVGLASGNGTRVIGCYPQSLDEHDIEKIYSSLLKD